MKNDTQVRFLVTGDLHFRSENPKNRKDNFVKTLLMKLHEVCDIAVKHHVNAIIIPGDIFDSATVGLSTISELACHLKWLQGAYDITFLVVSGNHDLPAGNKAALSRTPFGLLSKLGIVWDLENKYYIEGTASLYNEDAFNVHVTGSGFDFQTDTPEGVNQFIQPELAAQTSEGIIVKKFNAPRVHVVHSMLLASVPTFPMRHTLIDQVETDADIIISGHYHEGFGVIRRKDGKLFINPGALCRLSASKAEMERQIQVALLTIRDKTDFDAELIPLRSARPAEEVLDREAIVEKVEHENWLESFFEKLSEEGEAKFLEVQEILDNIASREKIKPEVKDEALKRIGEAREKLGRGAA